MTFYLGTHMPSWLASAGVPLFVSRRRLFKRRTFPRATCRWSLDSGAFTELSMFGEWRTDEATYLRDVRRYQSEIGRLDWAAPQDWCCEPPMLLKTGRSVAEHQRLTVENLLTLRMLDATAPIIPALQGWEPTDYLRCVDLYTKAGIDLTREPVVGLGSVCRRQHTWEIERLIFRLHQSGIRLHGFGFKVRGLLRSADLLTSSDSLAWSYNARRREPMPGCTHASCANCLRYAMAWRERLLAGLAASDAEPGLFRRTA